VSVELQLGLGDEDNGLLADAGRSWASWAGRFPRLSGIGGVGSLRCCRAATGTASQNRQAATGT
jgi:hypothetical protein